MSGAACAAESRHWESSSQTSSEGDIRPPPSSFHVTRVFLDLKLAMTKRARNNMRPRIRRRCGACAAVTPNQRGTPQSYSRNWFHSLPFQRFQALLTLFSKFFSSFPHGTCILSVSNLYLASDETYHQLCAPIPRNVTLRKRTVHRGL